MTSVKNIQKTQPINCKCDNWLDHWRNYCRSIVLICSSTSCTNEDLVGAQVVQKEGIKTYIIPLCKACINRTDEILVNWFTVFAPVKEQQTCGK